jgi:ATP-binding cassette, subfamily B, multidrug efflux pump
MANFFNKFLDLSLLFRILSFSKPYKNKFILTGLLTLLLAIVGPARPWLVQYTVDNYIVSPNYEGLLNMTLFMIAFILLEAILQFYQTYQANWLGQTIIKDLRVKVFKKIINFKLKYFDTHANGTLVTRSISDIETIAEIFSDGILIIIGDLLKLIVVIGVMFYTDWKLTLISLTSIPLLIITTNIFKNAIKKSFQDVRTQVARLNAFVQEHISGISIVQIFNREHEEYEKFKEVNKEHRDAHIRSIWAYSIFFPVVEILSALSLALLVWWGAKGVLQGEVSFGNLVAFILYIHMLFRPIRQLADRFNTLQMGMVSSERVFKLIDTDKYIVNNGTKIADNIRGEIAIKDLWFAYKDEDWVLKGISLDIKEGEEIAIVGATGAGKSSLINLISRFYEYNKGEILIDGTPIRDYELNSLRINIGVVLQDVFLFSDTVFNNITLKNSAITKEQVIEASKAIGAYEFIMKMPENFNYEVGERGALLSVGQRQLISFIRAYLYNPKILILDEATSSIDTESEELIQYALEKLTQNRTSIIIAHRLATIQKADKIVVMDKGHIIEQGNHFELLSKNGVYKKLYELQFQKTELNS